MTSPGTHAPIVVFAYKRADHLSGCIASLQANPEAKHSHLYVYCDGPRSPADLGGVQAVREFVGSIGGFASVTPVMRERNTGLANSIIGGVSELLETHDRVIVIEDDLLLSPYFLRYMNEALDFYARNEEVASIHAYCYPVAESLPRTFFMKGTDCWGWATWRRAWRHFNPDGAALLAELKARGLTREFDLDGAYPFTKMLARQVAGLVDSWAVRWHASCFLKGLLTLYPGKTLVQNLGHDASGTHSHATSQFDGAFASAPVPIGGIAVEPSERAREAFSRFLRPSLLSIARRVVAAPVATLRKVLR